MPSLANHKSAPVTTPASQSTKSPAIQSAMASARAKFTQALQRHKTTPFATWQDFSTFTHTDIPVSFQALPISYFSLKGFVDYYVNDTENRLARALAQTAKSNESIAKPAWNKDEGGLLPFNLDPPFRPIPRQLKAYTQCVRELGLQDQQNFRTPRSNACLIPLPAGEGKTAIAAMLIKRYQEHDYFGQNAYPLDNIIYVTPKRAVEKTKRFLAKAGVKDLGVRVKVVSYSELRSKKWQGCFKETQGINPIDGNVYNEYLYAIAPFYPALVIVDECHKLKKPGTKTTKLVYSWLAGAKTRWLYMSATAAVVVNDLFGFAIASRKTYDNRVISKNNWREVALGIGRDDPKKPNGAAMERFAKFFGDAIVKPPADPRKIKCYNSIITIPFDNPADRAAYLQAEQVWLEVAERLGKVQDGTERMNLLASFTVFRAAEEKIKAPYLARMAYQDLCAGRAPVIAVCFVETVKRVYAELTKMTYPGTSRLINRDDLSIIWGGSDIISPDECFTENEWTTLQLRIVNHEKGIDCLSKKDRAKFRKTTKLIQDRLSNKIGGIYETKEEQQARISWLKETRLDSQGEAEQQEEVDKFQDGRTTLCIFTLAAGGTAIDLDQQRLDVLPRTMRSTICYYLEEFVQAFGRAYRVSTVSDVYQYAVFFEGTIVADHVAPILKSKLESINKFSATGVNLEEALVGAITSGKVKQGVMVDKDELTKPVEQEDMDMEIDGEDDEADDEDDKD